MPNRQLRPVGPPPTHRVAYHATGTTSEAEISYRHASGNRCRGVPPKPAATGHFRVFFQELGQKGAWRAKTEGGLAVWTPRIASEPFYGLEYGQGVRRAF